MINRCDHKRVKKNYPFGRKSRADKYCKDCGEIITNYKLMKMKEWKRKQSNFRRKRK